MISNVKINIKFKKLLMIGFLFSALTACGDGYLGSSDLAIKQVPVVDKDTATDQEGLKIEEEGPRGEKPVGEVKAPVLEKPSVATMTLRAKVLRDSDISETALDNALNFYDDNINIIRNKKVISIFDVSKHSGKRRLYVIDTVDGRVSAIHVAHGKNSDKDNDGIATSFSNTNGSLQSSLGFMLTDNTYQSSKNGFSLKLDGLEKRNSKVRSRYVVIHGASYVSPSRSKMGRSYGCPAVSNANRDWYINKVKNGSLLYIYHAKHDG